MNTATKLSSDVAHTQEIFHCSDVDAIELNRLSDELQRLGNEQYTAWKAGETLLADHDEKKRAASDAFHAFNSKLHDAAMAELQAQGWGPNDALTIICRRGGSRPVDEPKALAMKKAGKSLKGV